MFYKRRIVYLRLSTSREQEVRMKSSAQLRANYDNNSYKTDNHDGLFLVIFTAIAGHEVNTQIGRLGSIRICDRAT